MMHSRRNFLKISIAALIAGLASKTLFSGVLSKSSSIKLRGKSVVVIGAGLAGLAAAKVLQMSGAKVVILEAEDYIGGRVKTDMSMGVPFEYGAGWIHGPSADNPIQALAAEVNAPTFVTDDDNLAVYGTDGKPIPDADYQRIDDIHKRLVRNLYWRLWRWDKRSIEEAVADMYPEVLDDPMGRWLLSAFIEFDVGAGIEDISAANAFSDTAFDGDDVIFTEGYDSILAPLIEGLDIRLNTPVRRISYNESGVTVNELTADYAICTVSLGILKTDAIQFYPALPDDMQEAITELGFGSVTKIALEFDKPFWDVKKQYFGMMTDPKGRWNYWLNYRTFSDKNILLGLSFGRYAFVADRMTQEEMTKDALDVLRSVWGKKVNEPLSVLSTHWSVSPNFKGAYSYSQVGGSASQYEIFAESIADRLFFAGEHTLFDYHGTTHGALLSGQRAAKNILDI